MPARRLRAWFLSAFSLAIAFVLALPVCFVGLLLTVDLVLAGPSTYQPGVATALVFLLIAGLIGVGALVLVSVALLAGDRFVWLRPRGRSFRPRLRLRTLVAAVSALAPCLGLLVFADRFHEAYHAARAHEERATTYRWLQGLDSGPFHFLALDPKMWSPRRLEYFRAMERHHDRLRRKYDAAAYRPWLSVPPDPPEPTEPDGRLDELEDLYLWRILRASLQIL